MKQIIETPSNNKIAYTIKDSSDKVVYASWNEKTRDDEFHSSYGTPFTKGMEIVAIDKATRLAKAKLTGVDILVLDVRA
jgi:hypothetical protein